MSTPWCTLFLLQETRRYLGRVIIIAHNNVDEIKGSLGPIRLLWLYPSYFNSSLEPHEFSTAIHRSNDYGNVYLGTNRDWEDITKLWIR